VNIFEIIEGVTSRIEPFHSVFLTEALRTNREFRKRFIELVLPSDLILDFNQFPTENVLIIKSEESFEDQKRIDVFIQDRISKLIIGIEVKTTDSSVSNNQLSDYSKGMCEKYPDYQIIMVFLTPFNANNLPEDISPLKINAIQKFLEFKEKEPDILSVHINWRDIVNLYKDSIGLQNSLYSQHKDYICKKVINVSLLRTRIDNIEQNRGLVQFFGTDTFEEFIEYLKDEKLFFQEDDKKYLFPLEQNKENYEKLIESIQILIKSDQLIKKKSKKNEVIDELLNEYENGNYGEFFITLFSILETFPFIWLKGKKRIGVRALHYSHKSSGVSIFTINSDSIEIRKQR
jgi:hypothetical protein